MVGMRYWNSTMMGEYQCNRAKRETEESHAQAHILDANYEKLYLEEVYKNQYQSCHKQRESLKKYLLKYKKHRKENFGK